VKSVINNEKEIIIKNSRFISLLYYIDDFEKVDKYLDDVKVKYKDATHYCYAYIINNKFKCSDDGEPGGTAGMPMLQVLKKNDLNNVLCITVRYFGGIKLGAGGLVRAYAKSVTEVLNDSIIILEKGYNITISFDYSYLKSIDYILKNIKIITKDFSSYVTYNLNVNMDIYNKLKNVNCDIVINRDIYL
jgi:uncharacterized YigZ family protein